MTSTLEEMILVRRLHEFAVRERGALTPRKGADVMKIQPMKPKSRRSRSVGGDKPESGGRRS